MEVHICSALTFVPASWLVIAKTLTTFCTGSSQVMNPGFTINNQNPSKYHAVEYPLSPVAKKFETYLEHGATITSAAYCDELQRGMKPAAS
jgi:hypothetical protein